MQSNKLAMNNFIPNIDPNINLNLKSNFASFTFNIYQRLNLIFII
jgi:hypothetical protein